MHPVVFSTEACVSALSAAQEPQAPQGGGGGAGGGGNTGGGGGGGGQPTNQPNTPQPQPGRPNTPVPQPTFPLQDEVIIRGRLISAANTFSNAIVEVRIETDGGQPVGFAYADSVGEFTFCPIGDERLILPGAAVAATNLRSAVEAAGIELSTLLCLSNL